ELVGKKVTSPKLEELKEETAKLEGNGSFTVEVDKKPVKFKLPEKFSGPRGQIGVYFGVNDIRFEKALTGTVTAVKEGSAAAQAGMKPGDQILAVGELAVVSNSGLVFGSMIDQALASVNRVDEVEELEIMVLRG